MTATLLVLLTILPASASRVFDTAAPRHPHYSKRVEVTLPGEGQGETVRLKLSYLTATFDAQGFEGMPEGEGWHLANAHFETSGEVKVGGHEVPAGKYRLLARRAAKDRWELVLDAAAGFSARFTEKAITLTTEYVAGAPRREHLSIDIHPSGDKTRTAVFLEVHLDRHLARTRIELP